MQWIELGFFSLGSFNFEQWSYLFMLASSLFGNESSSLEHSYVYRIPKPEPKIFIFLSPPWTQPITRKTCSVLKQDWHLHWSRKEFGRGTQKTDRSRAILRLGRPATYPLGRPAKGALCSVWDKKNLRVGYKDYLQVVWEDLSRKGSEKRWDW